MLLCYHMMKIHCYSSLGNSNAFQRFSVFINTGFRLLSKCTFRLFGWRIIAKGHAHDWHWHTDSHQEQSCFWCPPLCYRICFSDLLLMFESYWYADSQLHLGQAGNMMLFYYKINILEVELLCLSLFSFQHFCISTHKGIAQVLS